MLGVFSLLIFVGILMASVRGWVPQDRLPLQSMLVLGTIALTVLALLCGSSLRPGQLLAAMTLHPITATIAGFLLATAAALVPWSRRGYARGLERLDDRRCLIERASE